MKITTTVHWFISTSRALSPVDVKKLLLILLIASTSIICIAQRSVPAQAVYVELAGHALTYSINYQRRLSYPWSARVGIGYMRFQESETNKELSLLSAPLDFRYSIYLNNTHHEVDFGVVLQMLYGNGDISSSSNEHDFFLNPGLVVSYNYIFTKGVFLQASFTPFFGTTSLTNDGGYFTLYDPLVINGTTIHLWLGLGVGYQF